MPDHPQLDAPMTLTGLFANDDDSDEEEKNDGDERITYEIQSLTVAGKVLHVRQFDFHSHNANRVWPGTLNLADYLFQQPATASSEEVDSSQPTHSGYRHDWGNVLELGTATGLLAIRLAMASSFHNPLPPAATDSVANEIHESEASHHFRRSHHHPKYCCHQIVTSDVQDDDDNLIALNLHHNYQLNDIPLHRRPIHIPHTWGTGWRQSVEDALHLQEVATSNTDSASCVNDTSDPRCTPSSLPTTIPPFDTIVASDILLYVSSYPALVQTLQEIFEMHGTPQCQLVMSWNRRMKESKEFFQRMEQVGFIYRHEGKCIYTFRREHKPTIIP